MIRLNDRNTTVATIQEWLNFLGYRYKDPDDGPERLRVDGHYGKKTQAVVLAFQESMGLLVDGIVGEQTIKALKEAYLGRVKELNDIDLPQPEVTEGIYRLQKVLADPYDKGYTAISLRNDVAEAYNAVRREVIQQGAILTSSGGLRALDAKVTANRSPTSFHYLGLALDLFIHSGMERPDRDPYVIQKDDDNYHRVWARCSERWIFNKEDKPSNIELPPRQQISNVVTYKQRNSGRNEPVEDHFIDLTAIFKKHGFERIRARPKFYREGNMMSAEWWHFQYERSLQARVTTFGSELLKLYPESYLIKTAPWLYKDAVYRENWA